MSDDRLVTIAKFSSPYEARIVRNALDEEGIQSILGNEAAVGLFQMGAMEPVVLQVRESDAELALTVLDKRDKLIIAERRAQHADEDLEYDGYDDDYPLEDNSPYYDEDDDDESEFYESPSHIAQRAFRSAIIGLIVCPVQFYTLYLIMKLMNSGQELNPKASRQLSIAVLIAGATFVLALLWIAFNVLSFS